jgi:hypothetical protein
MQKNKNNPIEESIRAIIFCLLRGWGGGRVGRGPFLFPG